jgi:hypothetical protein
VHKTVVSPKLAITAPSACRAIFPVSKTSFLPPQFYSFLYISNILLNSLNDRPQPKLDNQNISPKLANKNLSQELLQRTC